MGSKPKNGEKKVKKVLGTFATILVLLFLVVIVILGSRGSTQSIEEVADRFKPLPEWTLISENITPPQFLCIGDNPCPSLHRVWETRAPVGKSDLEAVLDKADFDFPIQGSCDQDKAYILCQADGTIDDYKVTISIVGPPSSELTEDRIIISIRPQ